VALQPVFDTELIIVALYDAVVPRIFGILTPDAHHPVRTGENGEWTHYNCFRDEVSVVLWSNTSHHPMDYPSTVGLLIPPPVPFLSNNSQYGPTCVVAFLYKMSLIFKRGVPKSDP
jgi:hypothetical protein